MLLEPSQAPIFSSRPSSSRCCYNNKISARASARSPGTVKEDFSWDSSFGADSSVWLVCASQNLYLRRWSAALYLPHGHHCTNPCLNYKQASCAQFSGLLGHPRGYLGLIGACTLSHELSTHYKLYLFCWPHYYGLGGYLYSSCGRLQIKWSGTFI